jgi:hypothetical protein
MKYLLSVTLLFFAERGLSQSYDVADYRDYFSGELKQWVITFENFRLSDFRMMDSLVFDNNDRRDFGSLTAFLQVYKPILTFSRDSAQFIDPYSGQLNLTKEGNHYVANVDDGGGVYLCNTKKKYWTRIFYNSISQWIDEVLWVSPRVFILVGIIKDNRERRLPVIYISDESRQLLFEYRSMNKDCCQKGKTVYQSPHLKKMDIRGL